MKPEYIVVQAGGKGTRMKHLTRNKPKALVPVDNLPMLFHLFRRYPDSKYIIIGDYKYEVLEKYLSAFAEVKYELINGGGSEGTCAGLNEAFSKVPPNVPFMLIWSDLILPNGFQLPEQPGCRIGIARDFSCRWKYENHVLKEERSEDHGVAGMFWFPDSRQLMDVPGQGEFVRWLSTAGIAFEELPLHHVKEYGLLSEYQKLESARCRPFNRIYRENNLFVKEPVDRQGEALAVREAAWYKKTEACQFPNIPRIAAYRPLKMEFIDGGPIYEYAGLPYTRKRDILRQIVDCLRAVQALEQVPCERSSYYEAYIGKTFKRLEKVRKLVPFAGDEFVIVNGRRCHNVFWLRKQLEEKAERYIPEAFKLIHGDCTFSNIMLRNGQTPVLIDPRGYFGDTELYGDPAYDWAKLYYSIAGNYDQFNRKRFTLIIGEHGAEFKIDSNGWESLEKDFFEMVQGEVLPEQIKLIHAIIWLSLTTYAWEDYDSICGAFYNGLYYLEEALNEDIF